MGFTISNNTPSPGYVAWSDLHIVFTGVDYAIADGYTNKIYVWWDYSDPYVLQTTNTLPTPETGYDLQNDLILIVNKSGTAWFVPTTTILDGGLIVPGTIEADHIAANSISSYHIAAGGFVGVPLSSAASGARVEILPDDNTGLAIWAPSDQLVMAAFIQDIAAEGISAGDIYMGSKQDGKFVYWDAASAQLSLRGAADLETINGFDADQFQEAMENALNIHDNLVAWDEIAAKVFEMDNSLGTSTDLTPTSTSYDDDTFTISSVYDPSSAAAIYRGSLVDGTAVTTDSWTVGDDSSRVRLATSVSVSNTTVINGAQLYLKRTGSNASKVGYVKLLTYLSGSFTERASTAAFYLSSIDTSTDYVNFWFSSSYTYDSSHGELYLSLDVDVQGAAGTYLTAKGGVVSGRTLYKSGSFVSGKSLYQRIYQYVNATNKRVWWAFSTPVNLSSISMIELQIASSWDMEGKAQLYISDSAGGDQYVSFPAMTASGSAEKLYFNVSSLTRSSVTRIGLRATTTPDDNYTLSQIDFNALTPLIKPACKSTDGASFVYIATEREIRPAANAILEYVSPTSLTVRFPFFPQWSSVSLSWGTSYASGKYYVQMVQNKIGQPTSADFLIQTSLANGYDLIATLYHVNGTGFLKFFMPAPRHLLYRAGDPTQLRALNAGTASSWTNVSLSSWLPTGRQISAILGIQLATTDATVGWLGIVRSPVLQETAKTLFVNYGTTAAYGEDIFLTDTSANVQYNRSGGTYITSVTIYFRGYKDWGY